MARRHYFLFLLTAVLVSVSACGGGAREALLPSGEPQNPGVSAPDSLLPQDVLPKQAAPPPPVSAQGLPSLSGVTGVERSASISGPGWYPVELLRVVERANSSVEGGTMLHLDGSVAPGYAVYSVAGFDGNSYPTSLKVTLDSISGHYFVAFSDYIAGNWKFAGPFNGSAEVQIPDLSAYSSPSAYTSPDHVHYFAIFTDTGAQLTISGLSQGVAGGTLGPAPPGDGSAIGGDAGCTVIWLSSSSQWDPDFAGYKLQRAPLLSGDYVDAFADPTRDNVYFDASTVAGSSYRWRVAALDVSGNQSHWTSFAGGSVVGTNLPPVVHCTLPVGRLYGPRDVLFDLSATFDPEADPITEYLVSIVGGSGPISSPTPQITTYLQPGCYVAVVAAKAGTTGIGIVTLKLYPQWDSAAVVVREPTLNSGSPLSAIGSLRLFVDPSDAAAYTFGYDFTNQEYCVIANGVEHTFPGYLFPSLTGEPVKSGDTIYCPIITNYTIMMLSWTPGANGGHGAGALTQLYPSSINVYNTLGSYLVACAPDAAGHIWVFYARDDGGFINLYALRADDPAGPTELVHSIGSLNALDVEFNPATGKIELAGADPSGLHWAEFDPATATLGPVTFVDLAGAQYVDLEINPTTNRPALLYVQPFPADKFLYTERDGGGVWSSAVFVDNSALNMSPADMEFANGVPYALFALNDNQGRLYTLSSSGCSVRNTPADFAATGGQLSLQPLSGDALLALWRQVDGKMIYRKLLGDGSDTDDGSWDATEGQGIQMTAAAGPDGLHAIWYSLLNFGAHHMLSADGGQTWTPQADIPFSQNLSLGTNKVGDMYLSYLDTIADMQRLRVWDPLGPGWLDQGQDTSCTNTAFHAMLAVSPLENDLAWVRYNSATADIQVTTGYSGSGYTSSNFTSNLMPLCDGEATVGDFSSPFYALTVGGNVVPSNGYIAHYEGMSNPKWLYTPVGRAPHDLLTSRFTAGNNFGAAKYATDNLFADPSSVFYATHGESLAPIRYQRGADPEAVALPLPAAWDEFYQRDLRRTVSSAVVGGATALTVLASLDGTEHYMEWSNFGWFEALPMPNIGNGIRPVVFAGADGRWHMIYKEFDSDRIMCLSTQ